MAESSEVVVIGGGAAGCAAAFCLAEAGIRTTIVEREGVASYASGYSAGGLNPLQGAGIPGPLAPMAWQSFRMHLELWERLEEASGVDFHARRISSVDAAFDDEELAGLEETRALFEAAEGFSAQWADAAELLRDGAEAGRGRAGRPAAVRQRRARQPPLHPGAAQRRGIARRDGAAR